MELDREQKRLLMLHYYKLGEKAAKAAEKINQAWGAGTVGESTVYERFREFKAGNTDLTDKPRSGRPQEVIVKQSSTELKKTHRCEPECLLRNLTVMPKQFALFSMKPVRIILSFWRFFCFRQTMLEIQMGALRIE
ncbi:MAG: hypothetical protein DI539_31300 [Flavobacterium psychrophilum]|nr:MAG: hypothetical protein DI539_31300 [Flavobacterium psychrophilum]